MSETLNTRCSDYSPSYRRLLKELTREVRECGTFEDNINIFERPIDLSGPLSGYPRFAMGIESEDTVFPIDVPGLEKPLTVIGHIHERHIAAHDDGVDKTHYLTLDGSVIRDSQYVLTDTEVSSLADMLSETS